MLVYIVGNLFESPAHVLVNTVGVMGKGIAKSLKQICPEMFKLYQRYCESNKLTIGKLWLYKTDNKWILNFPTKTTWKNTLKNSRSISSSTSRIIKMLLRLDDHLA